MRRTTDEARLAEGIALRAFLRPGLALLHIILLVISAAGLPRSLGAQERVGPRAALYASVLREVAVLLKCAAVRCGAWTVDSTVETLNGERGIGNSVRMGWQALQLPVMEQGGDSSYSSLRLGSCEGRIPLGSTCISFQTWLRDDHPLVPLVLLVVNIERNHGGAPYEERQYVVEATKPGSTAPWILKMTRIH